MTAPSRLSGRPSGSAGLSVALSATRWLRLGREVRSVEKAIAGVPARGCEHVVAAGPARHRAALYVESPGSTGASRSAASSRPTTSPRGCLGRTGRSAASQSMNGRRIQRLSASSRLAGSLAAMEPTREGLASRCAIADDHDVGRLLTVGAISSPHGALGASCVVPVGRGIDPFAYVRRCISPIAKGPLDIGQAQR
jgi:hypothetical protein